LHTPGRWTLAFTRMFRAFSRSAEASTYTWQLPIPVSMTGTSDSRTTVWMRSLPPRGMSRSITPLARIIALALSRVGGTAWIEPSGSPASVPAAAITSISEAFECCAILEPRSKTALPAFTASPAASTVTLGRPS